MHLIGAADSPARSAGRDAFRGSTAAPGASTTEETAMYKRILLAYDGTHEGRTALFECTDVASFAEAAIHLLAVATPPAMIFVEGFEGIVSDPANAEEHQRMERVLAEGLAALRARRFDATGHLATGEPVEEICRVAAEEKCDLIVVGHEQKRSFLGRWWRGSVSANLLDHAPCSILIAMTPAAAPRAPDASV
jgi:nucleotide-binding universal stress UspA family protein